MTLPGFKGRHRWITAPSTAAVLSIVVVAALYAALAVRFPPGTGTPFAVAFAAVVLAANFLGDAAEQRRLRTVRGLAQGSLAVTPEALERAAGEAARIPDVAFLVSLAFVPGGAAATALAWWLTADVPVGLALRIFSLGGVLGPMAAVASSLLVQTRARAVVQQLLDAGLELDALRRALPARFQLRRRLVLFAAVVSLTPLVMITDMAVSRASRLLGHLQQAESPEVARAIAAAERSDGLGVVVLVAVAVLAMVAFSAWLVGVALGGPLGRLAQETERLARGEYGKPKVVVAEHETWAAATSLALLEVRLAGAIGQLKETAAGLSEATVQLVSSSVTQLAGANEQSGALAATTATTEELARSARQIAANAAAVTQISRETLEAARAGRESADAFTLAMQEVRQGNQAIADSVVKLNKRVQQVGRIIQFIDGIADRSDLLALNAELEGHKAGEVGEGFSLVAAEMRRLAESVLESTREIDRLIEDIRDATNAAVMATEAGVKATESGSGLAQQVSEELARIFEFAHLTSDAMQSIGSSTAQQQAGSDQLAGAMAEVLRATESSQEVSRQLALEAQELDLLAREVQTSLTTLAREEAR